MKRRVVLDTNVYVSRMLQADSAPGRAIELAWRDAITLMSPQTLQELEDVLHRPKFARYIHPDSIAPYLNKVWEIALHIEVTRKVRACRDPRDDLFLEVAVNGEANVIVTGDEDLLSLHPFHGIAILNSAAFLLEDANT
ncbi:putative toxin-antitoxin system toxin component, PIN family [Telmatobacter bradus]|uniref:putative toxin-antitoxin system toxin component, PIN family n=1 Tax=Telmatobacter bradus TaxID=474953 RepID=UPI003B42F8DF